ncbi:hypothetical protein B9Z55_017691 [Caenorhabditis nigoni]|uniref:Uncharacterized protein n=1 Tax=Caenorhabditis nigoni TaxID=1611254 RepID=A0A2G5TAM5_9PELO|nr:hypothetical protein B9Z55_017691 [Caenorhabditis nigoni]
MASEIAAKIKTELSAAGLSSGAIDGIFKIAAAYKPKDGHIPDKAEALAAIPKLFGELEAFIKTQPESDQTIYHAIIEKKKAEFAALTKSQ